MARCGRRYNRDIFSLSLLRIRRRLRNQRVEAEASLKSLSSIAILRS